MDLTYFDFSLSELSAKISMYALLVGLCNTKMPEFGAELVRELTGKLQDCLQNGDLMRAKLLVS
jgi:hypothetical protein